MGALDQLRGAARRVGALQRRARWSIGDAGKRAGGAVARAGKWIRENPRVTVAVVGGILLVCAWIAWAVYVTSENGASAGLGVMIAWPVMVAALALVSLPFIGGYMLFRRLSTDEGNPGPAAADSESGEAEPTDQEDEEGGAD